MRVVESRSRVTGLLREHAPADHADLPGPATERMLAAAEERMGIALPHDLRAWLLRNNLDLPEGDADDDAACSGFAGFPDEGSFFLGIRSIEKLHANRPLPEGVDEWIPFLSDQDGWSGRFVDARDGSVGSRFVGEATTTGEYPSLADCFDSVAEMLTSIAGGSRPTGSVAEGRLVWS